jgi:hypothetical protein
MGTNVAREIRTIAKALTMFGYDAQIEQAGGNVHVVTIDTPAGGVWVISDMATVEYFERAEGFRLLGLQATDEAYISAPNGEHPGVGKIILGAIAIMMGVAEFAPAVHA